MSPSHQSHKHIPSSFIKKKSQILAEISNHDSTDYNDKSPKGTIDSEIIDLIGEINAFNGYVTTSSCAGRVAVFVEGRKAGIAASSSTDGGTNAEATGIDTDIDDPSAGDRSSEGATSANKASRASGPGGKGHGNRWLYVSHSSISSSHLTSTNPVELHELFELIGRHPSSSSMASFGVGQQQQLSPRLIKLSFSPLILHILCANLHAAKGLLAAAINAGFRESGVQSLKALDDEEAGVMVGIRTSGLGFESVVGIVNEVDGEEVYRGLVDEGYLRTCVGVINERFEWNVDRRERLRAELELLRKQEEKEGEWEDKDVRRERKRMEGLRRKLEQGENTSSRNGQPQTNEGDVLNEGLFLNAT